MKSAVRRYDAVGRYGGEEFLIVLPGCEGDAARVQAERIREAVAAGPFAAGAQSLNVTCSIGVSCRSRPSLSDTDSLVREADLALYEAKKLGRNRVQTCTSQSDPPATEVHDLPGLALAIDQ
jgi:diguanylate cyclase (GGDEF)-like protein